MRVAMATAKPGSPPMLRRMLRIDSHTSPITSNASNPALPRFSARVWRNCASMSSK